MRKHLAAIFYACLVIAAAGALLVAGAGSGSAEEGRATFKLTNKAENAIMIKFFSQKRDHVWPGHDKHDSLSDDARHEFHLKCEIGEDICWGGSDTYSNKKYWGVGLKGDKACKGCCIACGHDVSHAWSLTEKPRGGAAPTPGKGTIDPGTVLVPAED